MTSLRTNHQSVDPVRSIYGHRGPFFFVSVGFFLEMKDCRDRGGGGGRVARRRRRPTAPGGRPGPTVPDWSDRRANGEARLAGPLPEATRPPPTRSAGGRRRRGSQSARREPERPAAAGSRRTGRSSDRPWTTLKPKKNATNSVKPKKKHCQLTRPVEKASARSGAASVRPIFS